MQLVVHVVVAIHGPGVFHREVLVGDRINAALHFTLDGRAESERVDHQGQIGHRRVDVVVLRAHLHVEIAGHSVHNVSYTGNFYYNSYLGRICITVAHMNGSYEMLLQRHRPAKENAMKLTC